MTKGRPIDHVVVVSADLAGAAAGYREHGFTLTPRASHQDHMGTSNHLAQFANHSFIELLEVDRPDGLDPHDFTAVPPRFGFGAFNRDFVRGGNGMSMLVLASDDARGDLAGYEALGLQTYAPFDFERQAKLPDGSQVTVGFSLGFVTDPALPGIAFFVCQQHAPEYFWKPPFQQHANGAKGISTVYIAAAAPREHEEFFAKLTGGETGPVPGGIQVSCGEQALLVLTPENLTERGLMPPQTPAPRFCGLGLLGPGGKKGVVRPDPASDFFIKFRD